MGDVHNHEHVKILKHDQLDCTLFNEEGYVAEYHPAKRVKQIIRSLPLVIKLDIFVQDPKLCIKVFIVEALLVLIENVYENYWHHHDCHE